MGIGFIAAIIMVLVTASPPVYGGAYSMEELADADYLSGRTTFQQRCSACHTLNEGGLGIVGPNLWRLFSRPAGAGEEYAFSDVLRQADFVWSPGRLASWLLDPPGFLPGNRMLIPEPVPEEDLAPLLSFMMVETGDATWPRPEITIAKPDPGTPLSERFPSFWNHLMTNTSRFRLVSDQGEFIFEAYFNEDGSVSANQATIRGFWHVDERDIFCYALYGLPYQPSEYVECFPVAAMAIPRFAPELWESAPAEGVVAFGGILPGRPQAQSSATSRDSVDE